MTRTRVLALLLVLPLVGLLAAQTRHDEHHHDGRRRVERRGGGDRRRWLHDAGVALSTIPQFVLPTGPCSRPSSR
jgi:hypothetical protein